MTEKILNIKKLNNDSVLPTKGSEYAAGMDLYAYIPNGAIVIPAGKTVKIGTGIATEIPTGCLSRICQKWSCDKERTQTIQLRWCS